jgi:MFS family permease
MAAPVVPDAEAGGGEGLARFGIRYTTAFTLYGAFSSAQVSRGIFIFYMLSHGVSLVEVGFVESCYQLARIVGEIPLGVLADRWQRRGTVQIGVAMHVLAALMFIPGHGLVWFMVIFALLGGGAAAQSGADVALLYDYLDGIGQEDRFAKVAGRAMASGYLALSLGTAAGGPLGMIYGKLPFIAEAVLIGSSLLFVSMMPEPDHRSAQETDLGSWRTLGQALAMVSRQPVLRTFVLFVALLEAGTTVISILSQGYLHNHGLSVTETSLALGFVTGLSAILSTQSHRLVKRGHSLGLGIAAALYLSGLSIMLIPGPIAAVVGFYLVFVNLDFLIPALQQFFNRLVTPDVRSTTLSAQAFCASAASLAAFPIATAEIARHGYGVLTLGVLGVSLPVLFFIGISAARRREVKEVPR